MVVVTSKHNDDDQYIWESNASEFSIVPDPSGTTLKRGTTVSLFLKEAQEFLEPGSLRKLAEKYSQFINFPIYLWESKVRRRPRFFCLFVCLFLHVYLLALFIPIIIGSFVAVRSCTLRLSI